MGPNQSNKYCHPAPLALAISSALAVTSTQAAVITVDSIADPGGAEVCSLRSAIQSVNSQAPVDGCVDPSDGNLDTIEFDPTVTGSIVLDGSELEISESVIISGPGAEVLSIDGNGNSRVFRTTDGTIGISDITITGGGNTPVGGGIFVSGTSEVTLSNCTITGNLASEYGGGVVQYAPGLEINNCTISDNVSGVYGGGLAVYLGNAVVLESTITDNIAYGIGGGLWVAGIPFVQDDGGILFSERSGGSQHFRGLGEPVIEQASLHVDNSLVSGNMAIYGGGIGAGRLEPMVILSQQSPVQTRGDYGSEIVPNLVVVDSQISGNGSFYGGGIGTVGYYSNESYVPLSMNRGLPYPYGRYNLVEIYQTTISGNSAEYSGGGVFSKYSESLLYGVDVVDNTAIEGAAGIFHAGNNISGGGIYFASERGIMGGQFQYMAIVDSLIAVNQLIDPPERGVPGSRFGAGIFNGQGEINLYGSHVSNNSGADFGGGIATLAGGSFVAKSLISGNQGGGLLSMYGGSSLLKYSRVEDNVDSGGMVCEGDGICMAKYSSITNNQGEVVGGIANNMGLTGVVVLSRPDPSPELRGVYGSAQGAFYLTNSTVSSNQGGYIGGIAGSYFELAHATVAMNQQVSVAPTERYHRGIALAGGAFLDEQFSVTDHSIIAGNALDNGSASDLRLFGADPIAMNYSLVQDDQGFTFSGSGNIFDQDPLLGPLDFNGSLFSYSHALLEGSPAIDAGDPNLASKPSYDQRGPGFPRVFNNVIDMGAFEFFIDEIFNDRFESTSP